MSTKLKLFLFIKYSGCPYRSGVMVAKIDDSSVLNSNNNDNPRQNTKVGQFRSIYSLILVVVSFGICWELRHHYILKLLLSILEQGQWGFKPFEKKLYDLETPINRVIVTTTGEEECSTYLECLSCLEALNLHLVNDNTYNFLVGGDGSIFDGCGWDTKARHIGDYSDGSIGIAFIGTFATTTPPLEQFRALRLLLAQGVNMGKLTSDYKIYPLKMFDAKTDKPGEIIINIIKWWPRYVSRIAVIDYVSERNI